MPHYTSIFQYKRPELPAVSAFLHRHASAEILDVSEPYGFPAGFPPDTGEHPVEAMKLFMQTLLDEGITEDEIYVMTHTVPRKVLGEL